MGSVNSRVKDVRITLKCSQKDFADSIGISRTHLSGIENGKDNPSMPLIKLICLKYGINEDWLVNEEGTMFPKDSGFSTDNDGGLKEKYEELNSILKNVISKQTGKNLYNMIESFSNFVSILSMPGLNDATYKEYLTSVYNIIELIEKTIYRAYMVKTNKSNELDNLKELLKYHMYVSNQCKELDEIFQDTLNCYVSRPNSDRIIRDLTEDV